MARVKGMEQIRSNLKLVLAKVEQHAVAGWTKAATEVLLPRSQEIVPVETGELKESGAVERQGNTVVVGYSAPHAIVVHEDLEAHHDQGRAKFLEEPSRQHAGDMLLVVAAEVKKFLAGGAP